MEDEQLPTQESLPALTDPQAPFYEAPKLEEHGTWNHVMGVSLPIG